MWGNSTLGLSWLMTLLAVGALEVSAGESERTLLATVVVVAAMASCVAVLHVLFRSQRWDQATAGSRIMTVLLLAGVPWGVEVVVRLALNSMLPLELLLLAGFRNAVLALAVFAHEPHCQRLGGVLSTFLVIFASALAAAFWIQGLLLLFAIAGIWWLMGSYWESIRGRLAATSESALPRRWTLLFPLALIIALTALPVAGTQVRALRGFMPSSGGTDWYSEAARSGLGDGDALVAGTEDIRSFAPIEDAPFLTSHEPSLYDMFDDTYDEPVRQQNQDRAVSIMPEQTLKQQDHHLAESQQANKQFSTLRQLGSRAGKKMSSLKSNAVLYLQGRVPVHLKLQVFDRYDGVEWTAEEMTDRPSDLHLTELHGRHWLRALRLHGQEIYGLPESHAIKVVHLDSNVIPAPTQLMGVHIDLVDRADMFGWAQPGVLKMERQALPQLTAIHLQSRVVDPQRLLQERMSLQMQPERYQVLPDDPEIARIRELAESWTANIPHGWPQVAAIVERLRAEYVLDPDARPGAETTLTVTDFLLHSRRGPDYQFASAAVCLLRSLGYSARLASGFYARPERFDVRSRHTPVLVEDVHFWAEVYAGLDDWIPIEPTPGYELLRPPPTLWEQMQQAALSVWRYLIRHPLRHLLMLATAIAWVIWRKRLADAVATLRWSWCAASDPRRRVQQTFSLLEQRCHRVGLPRPVSQTPARWLHQLATQSVEQDQSLKSLSGSNSSPQEVTQVSLTAHNRTSEPARWDARVCEQLFDWAAYAPERAPCPVPDAAELCRQGERAWTWSRLKSLRQRG